MQRRKVIKREKLVADEKCRIYEKRRPKTNAYEHEEEFGAVSKFWRSGKRKQGPRLQGNVIYLLA